MVTVPDHDLPALIRAANAASATDTRLFSLIDELAERENHRDALLDRMLIDESDVIEAAFKVGRLPPVPAETGVASKSAMRDTAPMPHGPIVRAAISPLTPQHGARPVPE